MGNCFKCFGKKVDPSADEVQVTDYSTRSQNENVFENLKFYRNERPAAPNAENIETILKEWKGDYIKLESNHDFIQWLFPIQTPGVNPYAFILQDHEAEEIRRTPQLKLRVRRAFEMMLDFYGMRLTSNDHFETSADFKKRFLQLNERGNHNFLRITRILKALKEFGYEELMLPWLIFLADRIFQIGDLEAAEQSFKGFWIDTLDADDQMKLRKYLKDINNHIK